MFAAGQILAGRYRLLRLLGGGGMGAVWAARNEAIDREVAIKVMLPQIADDPVALQRFFNEAKICGSIRHPGIVDVLDLGTAEDGSPFLVMEVLHGESLEALCFRKRRLLPSQILEIVRDVARTIALAHQKDVVHRDLKPANLFLHHLTTGQVVVKVLDFGISKVLTPGGNAKTTQTGAVVGSPAYMSPEQALGKVAIDHRTDIYALGVILYEAMSGRLPFDGENYNALIVDIATSAPRDLGELVPGLPWPVISLVRDAMAKDRNKRIQTMNELADRIEALLPGAAAADQAVAARSDEAVITGEQVVIGEAVTQAMALQKTASSLTTSVVLPKSPRRFLPLGIAGVIVAGIGLAVLFGKPSTTSPVVAHIPSTAVVVSSIPTATAAPPASAASPAGAAASGPTVSPGPPVSAAAPIPPASASAPPPARSVKALPPGKPPPAKGGGVWSYD